jgi:hypothetical protein
VSKKVHRINFICIIGVKKKIRQKQASFFPISVKTHKKISFLVQFPFHESTLKKILSLIYLNPLPRTSEASVTTTKAVSSIDCTNCLSLINWDWSTTHIKTGLSESV